MTSTIFPIFLIGFVVMENIFLWNYSQALFYVFTHLVTVVSLFYLTFICKTSYLRKNKKLGWQYISFKNLHLKTHYFTVVIKPPKKTGSTKAAILEAHIRMI